MNLGLLLSVGKIITWKVKYGYYEFNLKIFLFKVEEFEDSASLGAISLEEKIQVKGKGGMNHKYFIQCL